MCVIVVIAILVYIIIYYYIFIYIYAPCMVLLSSGYKSSFWFFVPVYSLLEMCRHSQFKRDFSQQNTTLILVVG